MRPKKSVDEIQNRSYSEKHNTRITQSRNTQNLYNSLYEIVNPPINKSNEKLKNDGESELHEEKIPEDTYRALMKNAIPNLHRIKRKKPIIPT